MSDIQVSQTGDATPHLSALSTAHKPEKSWLKIALEVALIATGVFLGMMGENVREYLHHQKLAHQSLERFRAEFIANRAEVERVYGPHVQQLKALQAYFQAHRPELVAHSVDPSRPLPMPLPDTSTDSAGFDYSAWELALATESLAYIDADLVARMSRVYRLQGMYEDSHRAIAETAYGFSNEVDWLGGAATYFGDASHYEALLLKQYNEILPLLDSKLGGPPPAAAAK